MVPRASAGSRADNEYRALVTLENEHDTSVYRQYAADDRLRCNVRAQHMFGDEFGFKR